MMANSGQSKPVTEGMIRRSLVLLVACFFFASDSPGTGNEGSASHLVLISIDGFNPQWYQEETWPMPFLQKKADEGAYARRARPTFPSSTRPGHVTLLTGWLPARHGVFNNSISYRSVKDSSILHAVQDSGGVTAAVAWPASRWLGPTDHYIGNVESIDFSNIDSTPPLEEGLVRAGRGSRRPGHSREYQRYITGTVRDAQIAAIAVGFIEKYKPNLLLLRFGNTDTMQHRFGRDGAAVRGIISSTDMAIAEIAAAVERAGIADRTVFIITGDHGMDDVHTLLRPNVWLVEAGLGGPDGAHFEVYGGSAFLRDANEDATGRIRAALEALPEDVRSTFTIFSRDQLDEIGADPHATLALNAAEGYAFNSGHDDAPALESVPPSGRHGSLPTPNAPNNYTGFVAWGAGIGPGIIFDEIGIEDVAPTIAEMLNARLGQRDGSSLADRLGKR